MLWCFSWVLGATTAHPAFRLMIVLLLTLALILVAPASCLLLFCHFASFLIHIVLFCSALMSIQSNAKDVIYIIARMLWGTKVRHSGCMLYRQY